MAKRFKDATIKDLIDYCAKCTDCSKCEIKKLVARTNPHISTCRLLSTWAIATLLDKEIDL